MYIHRIGNQDIWYLIDLYKNVYEKTIEDPYKDKKMQLEDLNGDDFEVFSPVQVVKTGYLMLNTESEQEVKKII